MYINTHIYMCVYIYIYIYKGGEREKGAYLEDRVDSILDHLDKVNIALFTQVFWFPSALKHIYAILQPIKCAVAVYLRKTMYYCSQWGQKGSDMTY